MTRRKQHKIESNCVTFDDDCYNEKQDSYYHSIIAMDQKEKQYIENTGKKIVNYFKSLLGV